MAAMLPPQHFDTSFCARLLTMWSKMSLKKEDGVRSKNGQASREDIFPPLAGAEAPDPDAACGRMVAAAEPQEVVV